MSEQIPFDQPFTETSYKPAEFKKLLSLIKEKQGAVTENQLISIGFISEDKRLSKVALFFKDSYGGQTTAVTCTFWPEFTKSSDIVLAYAELKGNLLDIISSSVEFVMNHSVNGFRKEATTWVDYFSYPMRSVTEGIVNAIGHRNYFISGTQIEINIFRDRLEISSPGSLLGVRNLNHETNIASIVPRRRNEVICAILEICRYMEKKGADFDKIEEDYLNADEKHKPYISSDGSSFTLTLPDLTYNKDATAFNSDQLEEVYSDISCDGKNDIKILGFAFNQPKTVKEIAAFLGVTPSTYFRKNTIAKLVKSGLLVEHQDKKATKYQSNRIKIHRR